MGNFVQSLTRQDASTYFAENCKDLFEAWRLLLQKTTLPSNITCNDNCVLEVFAALNLAIADGGPFLRLAYVRLTQTLAALGNVIETDRQNGRICLRKGRSNASIAVDIYLGTPGTPSGGTYQVYKRLRIGRR